MKKRWMILTLALAMSLLTACGGKDPAPASSAPADTKPAASQAEPADKSEATPDASTQTPAKTETPTQEPAKQDDQTTKQIPVLMGGALPFTNMQNLKTENYDDGGYYYEDMTQDSSTVIINSAYPSTQAEGQSAEDYAVATATALAQSDNCKVQSCEQNSTYTANLSYPVYVVTFTSGANEDMRMWTVFMTATDTDTYLYAFSSTMDAADELAQTYLDVFANLRLEDVE
jgi:hypothetical protein